MTDQGDSKSTTTEEEEYPLSARLSSGWNGSGYPHRHYTALRREYDKTGVPWLYWDEPALTSLLVASKKLTEGDCLLVLIGPRGTGKTQAAVEMAMKLDGYMLGAGKELSHMYAPLGELLNREKASWSDPTLHSPLAKAKSAGLLVLDEIQESSASEWERQTLTLLIDERYRNMKRTILIGNLKTGGLEKFFSKSISSRIKETGTIIEMAGKRYR